MSNQLNQIPMTNPTNTFDQFKQLLIESLSIDLNTNYNIDGETLYEFKGFPSIELGYDTENPNFGIYLSFSDPDLKDSFYSDLFNQWTELIPILTDYLIPLYTENTNNDPCSFDISFNTNHLISGEDEIWEIWEIKLSVTDYFS